MNTSRTFLAILTTSLLLSGCGLVRTKYDCPSPSGVTCMGPRAVYKATGSTDDLMQKKTAQKSTTNIQTNSHYAHVSSDLVVEGGDLTLTRPPQVPVADVIPEDLPVRMPAKIMRIWINDWQDDRGNLHASGRLYTEIEHRRWTVGEPAPETTAHLELIAPLTPAPTQAVKASPAPPPHVPPSHLPPRRDSGDD